LFSTASQVYPLIRRRPFEPVFGVIKSVLGFRQFSLRGLEKVSGEWRLGCLAWSVKRMAYCVHEAGKQSYIRKNGRTH